MIFQTIMVRAQHFSGHLLSHCWRRKSFFFSFCLGGGKREGESFVMNRETVEKEPDFSNSIVRVFPPNIKNFIIYTLTYITLYTKKLKWNEMTQPFSNHFFSHIVEMNQFFFLFKPKSSIPSFFLSFPRTVQYIPHKHCIYLSVVHTYYTTRCFLLYLSVCVFCLFVCDGCLQSLHLNP